MNSSIEEFPVQIVLPIQWGEQDAFGHVNNAIAMRWFESSRIAYLEKVGAMFDGRFGPILASATVNYSKQLRYPDSVLIGARLNKVGNTSLILDHLVVSQSSNEVAIDGCSVIVMFDYEQQVKIPVSVEVRQRIENLESK